MANLLLQCLRELLADELHAAMAGCVLAAGGSVVGIVDAAHAPASVPESAVVVLLQCEVLAVFHEKPMRQH